MKTHTTIGLPRWLSGKESVCQCRRRRLDPWVRKIPWRRKWQPALVFLPGKCHGQIEQDVQCHGDRILMHICLTGGWNALFHMWNMQVLSLVRKSSFTVNRVLKNIFCSSLYLKWCIFYDSWWVKCRFLFIPALPVKKTLVWLVKSIA